MATSGNHVLTTNALAIIEKALQLCQAKDVYQPLKDVDRNTALTALNSLIKSWQSQSLHLWKSLQGVQFLEYKKGRYRIGPNGDRNCLLDDFVETQTNVTALAAQPIIGVIDTVGMTVGDKIGVQVDIGTTDTNTFELMEWFTILSFTSTTITLSGNLVNPVPVQMAVYTYTTQLSRPNRILDNSMFRQTINGAGAQIPVRRWSMQQYLQQPDKLSSGTVVYDVYNPLLIDGEYWVWQTPSSSTNIVFYTLEYPIEIFINNIDEPDFPSEAFLPLSFALAKAIMLEYETPVETMQLIMGMEAEYTENFLGYDVEDDSINLQPDEHTW